MSALAIILVPAGILSALILFRWARTLALFAIGSALLCLLVGCAAPGYHYELGDYFHQTADAPSEPAWTGLSSPAVALDQPPTEIDLAVSKFCASATPRACMLFRSDAGQCIYEASNAYTGFLTWDLWKNHGDLVHESNQTILRTIRNDDPWVVAASEAPAGTTATSFRSAALRACLKLAAQSS